VPPPSSKTPADPRAGEDGLLRSVLADANGADETDAETAGNGPLAQVLYDRDNREAAKELLCDARRYYDRFASSAAPCRERPQWSKEASGQQSDAPHSAAAVTNPSADDDALLRQVLAQANVQAERGRGTDITASLAQILYDRHHREAAQEMLCDDRRYYDAFRDSPSPCRVRTHWNEKQASVGSRPAMHADNTPPTTDGPSIP
jgi:hypothetical protein